MQAEQGALQQDALLTQSSGHTEMLLPQLVRQALRWPCTIRPSCTVGTLITALWSAMSGYAAACIGVPNNPQTMRRA